MDNYNGSDGPDDFEEEFPLRSRMKTRSEGQSFLHIAKTYPTVLDSVLEAVQNAIDAKATRIGLILNTHRRRIIIRDNGDGVSREKFDEALASVGASVKKQGKLGRFGRGLISPLGKCEYFTFTSCPKGSAEYLCWTFNTADIESEEEEVYIPLKLVKNLKFGLNIKRSKKTSGLVPWRTQVNIANYSKDKIIGRITTVEDIISAILSRYASNMRENDIRFDVVLTDKDKIIEKLDVMAQPYAGDQLDRVDIISAAAGTVSFSLFLTKKGGLVDKGVVNVGELHDNFRFPISDLRRELRPYISEEAIEALNSGIFEGDIAGEYISLNPDRKSFEENESYMGFMVAIEKWFELYGRQYIDSVKSENQEEKLRELGERSLESLKSILVDDRFNDIRKKLQGLGIMDSKKAGKNPVSLKGGNKSKPNDPKPQPINRDPKQKPKRKKPTVKIGSFGLEFCHDNLENSNRLWEHDVENGILYINTRNPTWNEVYRTGSERRIMQLQELIAIKALTLLTIPDDWYEQCRLFSEEEIDVTSLLILNSHAFTGGRVAKKKK